VSSQYGRQGGGGQDWQDSRVAWALAQAGDWQARTPVCPASTAPAWDASFVVELDESDEVREAPPVLAGRLVPAASQTVYVHGGLFCRAVVPVVIVLVVLWSRWSCMSWTSASCSTRSPAMQTLAWRVSPPSRSVQSFAI
jgi:hypothetical protein